MNIVLIVQIVSAVLLTISVLLQSSSGGLGASISGGDSYHTKRGLEKGIFYLTIVLGLVFTATSIIVLTI